VGNHWGPTANTVFAAISLAVIVVIVWSHTWPAVYSHAVLSTALGFILGGAVGNLHDRLRYGGVRDFVQLFLPLGPNEFIPLTAVFNLADTALLIGAALLLLGSWFTASAHEEPGQNPPTPASTPLAT
jgi:signal peptidase II